MSASTTDNSTPLATAKSFLAGIKARDRPAMASLAHPDATACLIRLGKPLHTTVSFILDRIDESKDRELDEVSYDEVEHIDGLFATVWNPYRFYEDGKLHQTGSASYSLYKDPAKGWIITSLQDVAVPAEGVEYWRWQIEVGNLLHPAIHHLAQA